MKLYLGIFGGHQKSTAIAISDSRVLCCVTGKGLNLHTVEHKEVTNRLGLLLNSLAERLDLKPARLREQTARLVLVVPGASSRHEQETAATCLILNEWSDRAQYRIADDTWAGLIAGNLDKRGICAFAGTGAAVFVGLGDFPESKSFKIDGWGHILGDFGSGFQLSLEMFRWLGRSLDQDQTPLLFADLLREEPQISGFENVQRWFDQLYLSQRDDWRVRLARLAAVITRAAEHEKPDEHAVNLVTRSAEGLADSIKIAIERFKPETLSLPIVFQGGMFEHSRLYRHTVVKTLRQDYANEIKMAVFRPVIGAGLMACAQDLSLPSPSICHEVAESVQQLSAQERLHVVYPSSTMSLN